VYECRTWWTQIFWNANEVYLLSRHIPPHSILLSRRRIALFSLWGWNYGIITNAFIFAARNNRQLRNECSELRATFKFEYSYKAADNKPTKELTPWSKADSRPAGQEIPRLLLKPKFHYRVHKSLLLGAIQGQMNPVLHSYIVLILKQNIHIKKTLQTYLC
jgi:hypothetical protein